MIIFPGRMNSSVPYLFASGIEYAAECQYCVDIINGAAVIHICKVLLSLVKRHKPESEADNQHNVDRIDYAVHIHVALLIRHTLISGNINVIKSAAV